MAQVLILNADDREAQAIRAACESEGRSVVVASSEVDAWAELTLRSPQCAVVGGGIAVAQRMSDSFPKIPLILLGPARERGESPPPRAVERVLERPIAAVALAGEVESVIHEIHGGGSH